MYAPVFRQLLREHAEYQEAREDEEDVDTKISSKGYLHGD